ncbi:hypothetical protein [Kaistella jeonii]|uniref:DUF3999 domain-containing protein n=1 Tax=Kaistella jeonii TaxID=266749 RepID=A0A0C1FBU2_9FLAO|nr:hypothetical protein [Kaistella jeonii]KIA90547.1 hypothetical protein OA86_01290 [Kaistella jeonii]SFB71058.1 hypothetical protein SAMN05421876_101268 [Kaistella jeonii]VEI94862.1 Uncharacterised protein [Kaistella jeonii]
MNRKLLKKKKKMKVFKVLFLMIAAWSSAQNFTGTLQPVEKDGLTQIIVQPELLSALQNNWDHFRILDSKKNEVPYVLNPNLSSNKKSVVENLKIVAVNTLPNISTSVIISNENAVKIDQLNLTIANTNVGKIYSISGSNDQNQWYGLVYNESLNDLESATNTEVLKNFRFPLNNYKFLKFEFVDKKSLPIQVLAASLKSDQATQEVPLIQLKNFKQTVSQNKTDKTTRIDIAFNSKQVINGLKFTISAPQFYLRDAAILVNRTKVVKREEKNYLESLVDFQLNSKAPNQFKFGEIFEKNLSIIIQNEDNLPLQISDIQFFQEPVLLISELKAGEKYNIVIDSTLLRPRYDLSNFEENVQSQLQQTEISNLSKVTAINHNKNENVFWRTPLFMWLCIGLALLVIGYFSMGLLKDLGKND